MRHESIGCYVNIFHTTIFAPYTFTERAFPSLRNLHNQKCCVLFLPLLTIQNTRMSSLTHYFPVDDMELSITLPPQRPKRSPCDISQVLCNLGILKLER